MVSQIARQFQLKAFRWTVTEGMRAFEDCDQPQASVLKSQEILSYITTNKALDLLVRNLAGLTATDARHLALKAIKH